MSLSAEQTASLTAGRWAADQRVGGTEPWSTKDKRDTASPRQLPPDGRAERRRPWARHAPGFLPRPRRASRPTSLEAGEAGEPAEEAAGTWGSQPGTPGPAAPLQPPGSRDSVTSWETPETCMVPADFALFNENRSVKRHSQGAVWIRQHRPKWKSGSRSCHHFCTPLRSLRNSRPTPAWHLPTPDAHPVTVTSGP